ncbi:SA1320 family protein [Metabacillus fastidiosus]|uniref:SA1320 family protein n=1 Tax=Metabacillus fastidiosus TaxID=1458 RepID=UPI003D2A94FD
MSKKYNVTKVGGNSLGRGSANGVAVRNPGVTSVTLNAALLPEGMVDPNKKYDNITNYYSGLDILMNAQMAGRLDNRVPGEKIEINNGVPGLKNIVSNHMGYPDQEKGKFVYEIGKEGEIGYGKIESGADVHIVTSAWTGQSLHGESSGKIEINHENLKMLEQGLQNEVGDRLDLVYRYMKNSVEIVRDESSRFNERVETLQNNFQEIYEELIEDPWFSGLTAGGNILKAKINELISFLDTAEKYCLSLNAVLNSPPAELIESILGVNIDVETLFDEARSVLKTINDRIDDIINGFIHIINDKIPLLFKGGTDAFSDAIVGELTAHYNIVDRNREKLVTHLKEYRTQVKNTADSFKKRDEDLAGAISRGSQVGEVGEVQKTNAYPIEESAYMKTRMKIKEIHLNLVFQSFKTNTSAIVIPILGLLKAALSTLKAILEGICAAVKAAANVALYSNIPTAALSIFTDFDEKIRGKIDEILKPLNDAAKIVEGVKDGVGRLIIYYPVLLDRMRPYINEALFTNEKFSNVHKYNFASINILKEMQIVFDDIVKQLSNEKAQAIDLLCNYSKNIKTTMGLFEEQIDRVTL